MAQQRKAESYKQQGTHKLRIFYSMQYQQAVLRRKFLIYVYLAAYSNSALLYFALLCPVLLYFVLLCLVLSCLVLSCLVLSCLVLSFFFSFLVCICTFPFFFMNQCYLFLFFFTSISKINFSQAFYVFSHLYFLLFI